MTRYQVTLMTVADAVITVEADDKEAAIEAAIDEAPALCAQCAGWRQHWFLEIGEWDVPHEVRWGNELPQEQWVEVVEEGQ